MIARIGWIVLLSLLFNSLVAQNKSTIKRLKAVADSGTTDDKIGAYNQLGWEYRKVYPDSSIFFLNNSLELLELVEDKTLEPESYNYLGVAYLYKGDYLLSYDYHDKAKEIALANKDSLQYAHALNSLGRLFEGTAAYDKAIEYYSQALTIFELLDDRIGLAYIYSSLATFYQSQKSFMKAEEMSKQALKIRLGEKLWAGASFSYLELAKIYKDWQRESLALSNLQLAKQYSDSVQANLVLKAEINTEIASLYRADSQFKPALELLSAAEEITQSISNQNLNMKVFNEFGKLYYDLGEFNNAIAYHEKVVEASNKSAFWQELKDAYFDLSKSYEGLGNTKKSFEYFKKYNEYEIKFLDTERARMVQQYVSRLALETRAKENELLQIEKQKNEALIAEQKIRNLALMGLVVVMFILLLTFFVYNYRRRRANQLLIKQKNELADINLQKDTLMNILAHDLKAPFNRIIGLCDLIQVDKGNEAQYVSMIGDMGKSGVELIQGILEVNKLETGDVQENVRPINIKNLLNEKIANHIEDAKSKEIELISDIQFEGKFVTNQLFLERVIDNLISNAIKYSGRNTEVRIEAKQEGDKLVFSIADQGPGFTEEDKKHLYQKFKPLSAKPTAGEASNGLGLSLVKTLIDKLKGHIDLDSEVGQGSTFNVVIPEFRHSIV